MSTPARLLIRHGHHQATLFLGEHKVLAVTDERYLSALQSELPGLLAKHRPGLVFYNAGVDPAADDRLGDWSISPEALLERARDFGRASS